MLYKVNERVRVIPRNKNEPWAGHSGLVVGYDEEHGYKLRFPQRDVNGFIESELELDTTQYLPFSNGDLEVIMSALNFKVNCTLDQVEQQPYRQLYQRILNLYV